MDRATKTDVANIKKGDEYGVATTSGDSVFISTQQEWQPIEILIWCNSYVLLERTIQLP